MLLLGIFKPGALHPVIPAPIKALPSLCFFRLWRKNPSHPLCGWSVTQPVGADMCKGEKNNGHKEAAGKYQRRSFRRYICCYHFDTAFHRIRHYRLWSSWVEFLPFAALLGIYACLLGGICASLLGGTEIQITAPKAPLSLLLAAFVAPLALNLQIPDVASRNILIVGLASLCVLIAGIVQLLFGTLRLGNLIKYVPYPVVSGFMNGIAVILILEQIGPLVGARGHVALLEIFHNPTVVQPLTLVVGLTTIIAIFCARRFIKAVPASLIGLVVGTALFYALKNIPGAFALGPVIGNFSFQWPKPDILPDALRLLDNIDLADLFPGILITGFVLGSIGALESLLSSVAADNIAGTRHKSNKELIGQGIGNMMNAVFSALPSAGSELHNMANYRAGGRTRRSSLICGLLILLIVMTLGSVIGKIPLTVIAGIIMYGSVFRPV